MYYYVIFCSTLGGAVFFGAMSLAFLEIVRAARQSYRIATVVDRIGGRRRPSFSTWARSFKYELTAWYSALRLGIYEIPRDLNQKIRRSR